MTKSGRAGSPSPGRFAASVSAGLRQSRAFASFQPSPPSPREWGRWPGGPDGMRKAGMIRLNRVGGGPWLGRAKGAWRGREAGSNLRWSAHERGAQTGGRVRAPRLLPCAAGGPARGAARTAPPSRGAWRLFVGRPERSGLLASKLSQPSASGCEAPHSIAFPSPPGSPECDPRHSLERSGGAD